MTQTRKTFRDWHRACRAWRRHVLSTGGTPSISAGQFRHDDLGLTLCYDTAGPGCVIARNPPVNEAAAAFYAQWLFDDLAALQYARQRLGADIGKIWYRRTLDSARRFRLHRAAYARARGGYLATMLDGV